MNAEARNRIVARDKEVYANLGAFYQPDHLTILSELANMLNVAVGLNLTNQSELALGISHCISVAGGALSRLSGHPIKRVGDDIQTLARNRREVIGK